MASPIRFIAIRSFPVSQRADTASRRSLAADFPAGEKAVKLRTRYFDEVASLYQTYWPNQPVDDSAFYNNYFLCTLTLVQHVRLLNSNC